MASFEGGVGVGAESQSPAHFVVRLWLDDRPGTLGLVASRIGAVRGDVTSIEVLERGGGRAIDEIAVALPDASYLDMLGRELAEVDGVAIEEIRSTAGAGLDHGTSALELSARVVAAGSTEVMLKELVAEVAAWLDAAWAAVVDPHANAVEVGVGEPPSARWLAAFLHGSRHTDHGVGRIAPDDVAWGPLGSSLDIVCGRHGRPFRERERRQLAAVARIVAAQLAQ